MFTFILHPERNKSLLRRHPWVFSKAIAHVLNLSNEQAHQEQLPEAMLNDAQYQAKRQDVAAGELCQVRDSSGKFMAWCHFSPYSQIMLRVISFALNDKIDYEFFRQSLQQAIDKRQVLQAQGNDGVRLVAAEGDYLPGLIVDRYNNVISIAITSWGMEANYQHLIKALHELLPECYLYERSDGKTRPKEKLPLRRGAIDYTQADPSFNLCDNEGKPLKGSQQVTSVPMPQSAAATDSQQRISVDEAIAPTLYVKEND